MYSCGGSPDEDYHGLDAGYAISELKATTLGKCSKACANNNPN